ncbi:MAG: pyridoxamine 5'-phosphate oxidase family protein [Candidatus Methanomethylophilus sp.]|nr:pyridoxamine 5'-phosphate oxidase family protein [Methanomethylophilus sp.]MDD4222292.1 pyridoxamine 5'-phosphate oxidase family protein [Methanomethylophilus sp.]
MTSEVNERSLTADELLSFLEKENVGILATVNEDETPYVIPMHYVLLDGKIYLRTGTKGHKISNIMRDSRCSFAVLGIFESDPDKKACFRSSVIKGNAKIMEDGKEKMERH